MASVSVARPATAASDEHQPRRVGRLRRLLRQGKAVARAPFIGAVGGRPRRAWPRRRTRARCVTNAGVSAAAERRRIGTASATDTSRRAVYSAVRRLFAACGARHAPRIRRDGRADLSHAGCRSRACPGRGILGCVRPVSHGAPSPRHTTERVVTRTGHPSGSPLRNSCSARRRCTPSATQPDCRHLRGLRARA